QRAPAAADADPDHPGGQNDPDRQLVAVKDHQQLPQEQDLADLAGYAQRDDRRQGRGDMSGHHRR
ncbi:hypothetical protein RZS08_13950, partial [Arthrospira platensis SPKY1]|nr:hypothetical protein [Arthrospira platensis SPKY1]